MPFNFDQSDNNIFFRCVEDSSEAIMISDAKGVLTYVNPAWTKAYGYSREEAIGKTPRLLHSGLQPDDLYRQMWSKILDPQVGRWNGELINRAKDGSLVPVFLTITPYRDTSGIVAGFMGIATDLTLRKQLESQVAHQDRLASIGMLASGVAHEVGTPLGVVRGRAEFLMMKTEDSFLKKNLAVITSEIDRISKIIRSLLRISRSFTEIQMNSISPRIVIDEVLSLLSQKLRDDDIAVIIEVDPNLLIRADSERLSQVLLNIFMNAIHAIEESKLKLHKQENFLRVGALARNDNKIEILVEDSGCGISPENLRKLFKPFFTTKDVGQGTGLGLAIVAQMMREMEASIKVESVPGEGAKFTMEFQAATAKP
jgi:two-component system cell cycle sensor histidine kinase/response regulator CckA